MSTLRCQLPGIPTDSEELEGQLQLPLRASAGRCFTNRDHVPPRHGLLSEGLQELFPNAEFGCVPRCPGRWRGDRFGTGGVWMDVGISSARPRELRGIRSSRLARLRTEPNRPRHRHGQGRRDPGGAVMEPDSMPASEGGVQAAIAGRFR